jgi:signal transduction histidine kinase
MKKIFSLRNSLFLKISAALLLVISLLGIAYVLITANAAAEYYKETTQRLNASVAEHLLHEVNPIAGGEVNDEALGKIMHSMMAVNPTIEVYLLDPAGTILKYVVLDKNVRLKSVNLTPVRSFVAAKGNRYIEGDDPRNPGKEVVFSAAEVVENGKLQGYIYLVLASEEFELIASDLFGSYILKIGIFSFAVALLAAFLLGLLLIYFLTRSLQRVHQGVLAFQSGDLNARVEVKGHGETAQLGHAFNRMADTILSNIEDLKQVDTMRRDLIANVSHDLRSPMAVIHGYIETLVLKEGKLTQQQQNEYLEIILKSSEKLKKLVADLFELSRLDAKQIVIQKEPLFLNELLFDIAQQFELIAKQRNIKIDVDIPQKMPAQKADISLMNRVFQNLMENAIKYSPDDSTIQIKLAVDESKVNISFANEGVGIKAEDLPHIFDRYFIADQNRTDARSTGLGLAIVKKIIELHQAEITVWSKVNDKTCFDIAMAI